MEGKSDRAATRVGRRRCKSQRGTEKALGRAGSPTRAARIILSLQRLRTLDPALPYWRGVTRGIHQHGLAPVGGFPLFEKCIPLTGYFYFEYS